MGRIVFTLAFACGRPNPGGDGSGWASKRIYVRGLQAAVHSDFEQEEISHGTRYS